MTNLYDNIRKRREQLGLTQGELAEMLGYKSRSTIARIESGENDLNQTKIVEFAKALRVSTYDLMNDIKDEPVELTSDYFTNKKDAIKFLLEQKVIAANTGIDISEYSDEEITQFANRLLDYARFLNNDKTKMDWWDYRRSRSVRW